MFLKEFRALGGNRLFSNPFLPIGTYLIVGLTASLGVAIATIVVVVIADIGGGGEWDVGGGNLGCVMCCVAQVATHGM